MKHTSFIIPLLLSAGVLAGCTSAEAPSSADAELARYNYHLENSTDDTDTHTVVADTPEGETPEEDATDDAESDTQRTDDPSELVANENTADEGVPVDEEAVTRPDTEDLEEVGRVEDPQNTMADAAAEPTLEEGERYRLESYDAEIAVMEWVNTASASELKSVYGIGDVKSETIIEMRPFDDVDDLVEESTGVGPAIFRNIVEHLGYAEWETD